MEDSGDLSSIRKKIIEAKLQDETYSSELTIDSPISNSKKKITEAINNDSQTDENVYFKTIISHNLLKNENLNQIFFRETLPKHDI